VRSGSTGGAKDSLLTKGGRGRDKRKRESSTKEGEKEKGMDDHFPKSGLVVKERAKSTPLGEKRGGRGQFGMTKKEEKGKGERDIYQRSRNDYLHASPEDERKGRKGKKKGGKRTRGSRISRLKSFEEGGEKAHLRRRGEEGKSISCFFRLPVMNFFPRERGEGRKEGVEGKGSKMPSFLCLKKDGIAKHVE